MLPKTWTLRRPVRLQCVLGSLHSSRLFVYTQPSASPSSDLTNAAGLPVTFSKADQYQLNHQVTYGPSRLRQVRVLRESRDIVRFHHVLTSSVTKGVCGREL